MDIARFVRSVALFFMETFVEILYNEFGIFMKIKGDCSFA